MEQSFNEEKSPSKEVDAEVSKKEENPPSIVQSGEGSQVVVQHIHTVEGGNSLNEKANPELEKIKSELQGTQEQIRLYRDEIETQKELISNLRDEIRNLKDRPNVNKIGF